MPDATITYNGGGGDGNLFAGMKFYMLQRVPFRDKWKELVTSNGGEVVLAEAHSNIIIADHARDHQPIDSISWTFIEKSVKNGRLEDVEDHRAGAVGSAQPARQGRIPFSEEDDRVLMEWCTRAERQGLSVKGNVLFKQLEKKNPRHTFQSWRDRWVKKLAFIPRPSFSDDEAEEEEEVLPQTVQRKQVPRDIATRYKKSPSSTAPTPMRSIKRNSVQTASGSKSPVPGDTDRGVHKLPAQKSNIQGEMLRTSSTKPDTPVRRSSPPLSSQTVEPKGSVFCEEETEKLVKLHDDILTVRDDQTIDFWIQWSKECPEHTAQEWYNHFKEYVNPTVKSRIKKGKSKEMPPAMEVVFKTPKVNFSSPIPKPVLQRIIEVKDSQDQHSNQVLKRSSNQASIVPYASDEVAFTDDLLHLADRLKVDVELNYIIGGRSISMFNLWEVVMTDYFGGFQHVVSTNLWPKVANQLGFDLEHQPEASRDLEAYFQEYEELLLAFEELARDNDDEELEEDLDWNELSLLADQLLEMIEHNTDPVDVEEEENDDDIDSPQVSPHQKQPDSGSRKRLSAGSSLSTKRQRVDKGKSKELEIPSTPEDIKNPQTFRHTLEPSPLKNASFPVADGSDKEYSDEEDELFVPTNGQGLGVPRPQSRNLEPETQDFHFPESTPKSDKFSSPYLSSPPPARIEQIYQSQTRKAATRGSARSTNVEDLSTQSHTQSQMNAIIDKFIADLVDRGFPHDIVIQAMQATTLKMDSNVEIVAESLQNDECLPNDIRGVWTPWDDDELDYPVESKQYRQVLLKHGPEEIEERKRFLEASAE